MSSISADFAKEKMHGLSKPQPKHDEQQKEHVIKQDATLAGMQWGYQVNAPKISADKLEVMSPSEEDIATLSTTVSTNDMSVSTAPKRASAVSPALEASFRQSYRQSRSHNLLLERFMSNVKFSAVKGLCSLLGMSAEEQNRIQGEVRGEALAEIDAKLKQDWAYSKALLEIVG